MTDNPGFTQVDEQQFFRFVSQANLHPQPVGTYDIRLGYKSEWKTSHGQVMAVSDGATHLCESRFFVRDNEGSRQ